MPDEFQTKAVVGVPLYKVAEHIELLSSESVSLLIRKGHQELPRAVVDAMNTVLRVETVMSIMNGGIEEVYDFRIIQWKDYPALLRGIRRAQAVVRFFMFGFMKRRPAFYDRLLGVTAVPEFSFYDQIHSVITKCGLPNIVSSILLVNLQPIIAPISRKQMVRAYRRPQPDCIEVLYKYTLREQQQEGFEAEAPSPEPSF